MTMLASLSNASMLMLIAKATIILVAALGITIAMQRASAGARHLVWLVTLGTLLFVPALAAWSPLRLEILPSVPEASTTAQESAPVTPSVVTGNAAAPAPAVPASYVTGDAASRKFQVAGLSGFPLVVAIWGFVVFLLAGWLAWGALAVRRIVRNAHPLDTQDWRTPLWEISDRLELDEPPRLLGSNDARMPFACGFSRPTIVLPADCETWTIDRRRAVLLHELAHVKRHDLIGHTLGRIACAVYWFHPLVWTAAKQLRSESERACDDLALSCGAKASDYAEHLLDIVTSVRRDATPAVALAMARRKEFEGRMLAILDPELRHSTPNRRQSMALVGSLALIAIVVGAAAPAPRASEIVIVSSVPTATTTPEIRKDFTPRDVAEDPSEAKAEKKWKNPEPAEAEPEKKQERRAEVVNPEPKPETQTAPVARARIVVDAGVAVEALSRLGLVDAEKPGKVAADERPTLLANILRNDSDPSLRRLAAWGLSEYSETQVATEALAHALRRDSEVSVREMAGWALSDGRRNTVAVSALMEALRADASDKVRSIAAWSLGGIGDEDAVPALVAALSDANKAVRARAVWAIGSIGPRKAPPALFPLLRDPQPIMRQLAAWALFEIEDPAAASALQTALQSETDTELKMAYIRALAAMGEKSVDAIRGLLLSPDPKIKSMAVRALAGGNGAGPWPWPWPEPRPHP